MWNPSVYAPFGAGGSSVKNTAATCKPLDASKSCVRVWNEHAAVTWKVPCSFSNHSGPWEALKMIRDICKHSVAKHDGLLTPSCLASRLLQITSRTKAEPSILTQPIIVAKSPEIKGYWLSRTLLLAQPPMLCSFARSAFPRQF